MSQKMADIVKQITAMLTALMMFLGALGYTFDALNPNTIEAFGIFLTALIPLGITLYGIYMNTYASRKAFKLAEEREAQRLIDEGKFDPHAGLDAPKPEIEIVPTPESAEDGGDLK